MSKKLNTDLIDDVSVIFKKPILFKEKNWLIRKLTKKNISITIGRTVYISEQFNGLVTNELVMHESQHVADQCVYHPDKNMFIPSLFGTLNFYLEYAFPFIFTVPLLLITPFISMLAFLIALGVFALSIILLPYLSGWRKKYELRGYMWNFLIQHRSSFSKTFSGWTYMRMDRKRNDQYYIDEMKKFLATPDSNMMPLLIIWSNYNNCQSKELNKICVQPF